MKKIIGIILGLFLVLSFAGCNSDGSEINIDMDEFIANPTNLTISGTTLEWDDVEDASGYIVYANEEEVDKVKTNSFDFSSLSGDLLVFQVRTRAPRGMQDSALSAKLAYVENKTEEIAAVKLALSGTQFDRSDEFSEELVNKGMLSSDVEDMVDEMDDFESAMESVDSFDDMMSALRDLVAEANNIEAIVSAFVKTELVGYLEDEIDNNESRISMWEDEKEDPYSWYDDGELQERIDSLEAEIDTYEEMIDQIEDDADSIVLAITSTIEYFISVEEMISEDLISLIDGLTDVDSPSDLNATELFDIKEEIVYVLRETMPSEEELVLVMELADLITSLSGTTINYDTTVENYKGKMAAQSLYSIEAFTNFLDTFDTNFFGELVNILSDEDMSGEMIGAETAIMVIEYFNTFYDDNQDLLDTINDVFSEEEQEALFEEYADMLDDMDGQESVAAMMTNINFQQLLDLQTIFDDSFGAVLDAFVESDGEIIRQFVIMSGYSSYRMESSASGIIYHNSTLYNEAKELTTYDLLAETMYLLDAFLQSIDESDMGEITNFVLNSVFDSILAEFVDMGYDYLPFTETEILAAKTVVETALESTDEDMLTFLQNLVEYVVDEEVFEGYQTVLENVYAYYSTEYGSDYSYDYEMVMDDYKSNASLIFVAGAFDDFMTTKNRGNLDDILETVFDTMSEDALLEISGFSTTEVNSIETAITTALDLLSTEFDNLKDLDYTDLDQNDLDDIESFQEDMMEAYMSIYGIEEK